MQNDIDSLVSDHNSQLDALASSFNASNEGAVVLQYDLSALFQEVLADPTGYAHGTNDLDTTQAAGFGLSYAADPENYVFWDVVSGPCAATVHTFVCEGMQLCSMLPGRQQLQLLVLTCRLSYMCCTVLKNGRHAHVAAVRVKLAPLMKGD